MTIAAIESTSTYWKASFYCLDDVMEVWLLNAAHMKAIPGRKTDVRDAEWIAQLLEHGLLHPSMVPPPAIRQLRMLTRYRVQLMGDRTREAIRLEMMLEDASIMLSSVASSMFPSAAHLAAWAGVAPRIHESAGKRTPTSKRHGNEWLTAMLVEAAGSVARMHQSNYLSAQHARIAKRRGTGRAQVAVAHSILVSAWHTLTKDEPYQDLGARGAVDDVRLIRVG